MQNDNIPKEIAELIERCYRKLPDEETYSGAAASSDVSIMEFRKTKLQIASECVFAGLGINRETEERTQEKKSDSLIQCPFCREKIDGDEWIEEAMSSPVNIICNECGGQYSISATPSKIVWTIAKK